MDNPFKGAGVYLSANMINSAIPLLLLPVMTRFLSIEEYGQVAIFTSLIAGFGTFIGLNASGAANIAFLNSRLSNEGMASFLGACYQIAVMSSLFMFICVAVVEALSPHLFDVHSNWLYLCVFVALCQSLVLISLGQWQVRGLPIQYGALQVSQSTINAILSLLLVVVFSYGFEGRVMAIFLSSLAASTVASWTLQKSRWLKFWSFRLDHYKDLFCFGLPLLPHTIGVFVIGSFDRLYLSQEFPLSDVGVYMLAVQLASLLPIVFDAANKAFFPWMYKSLKEDSIQKKTQIVGATYFGAIFLILIAIIGSLFAPSIIKVLAGAKYVEASAVVPWLLLGQVFSGVYLSLSNILYFAKKSSYLSLVTICIGALHLLFLTFFCNAFGFVGAGVAFATTMFVRLVMVWVLVQYFHPMPWLLSILIRTKRRQS